MTVIDKNDPNHKRDGFVRDSTTGPFHPSLDTNEYKVWFEPGEPDSIYKGAQLEPNSEYMEPNNIPDGVK